MTTILITAGIVLFALFYFAIKTFEKIWQLYSSSPSSHYSTCATYWL